MLAPVSWKLVIRTMLSLLHRHILKEILVATGLAMGLFIFVLLVGNALRDVAELVVAGKLEFWVFVKVLGLLIPYVASVSYTHLRAHET